MPAQDTGPQGIGSKLGAVAAEFSAAGLTMLDAPISGSPITLAQGKASIMVGGDEHAFERARPVV